MTQPVPNQNAPIAEIKKNARGQLMAYLITPWNSFFQQLVQPAPAVVDVTLPSPFTANANGTVFFTGATTVTMTRGSISIVLTDHIVPISIGDTLSWTGAPTVQFLGA